MKILCTVKFVPDVDKFKYDFENNTVVRKNIRMIINPEDANAIAFALKMKAKFPEMLVEAVTMGPKSIMPLVEDLVRVGVDKVTVITDKCFLGSDSYATSKVLGAFIKEETFDCILTGTHSIDGDTSHVPSQLAEILDISQMSNVVRIDEDRFNEESVVFTVDSEIKESIYEMKMPGVISLNKDSKYKMPYIKYEDLNKDVKDKINIISNSELDLMENEVGVKGSLTKVNRTFVKEYKKRAKNIVKNDEEGIGFVFKFLKDNGYIKE
ncbi:MAG: electron transfer flavoprotein subunit beta/FixA family protein [Sedimentibacter sp.]